MVDPELEREGQVEVPVVVVRPPIVHLGHGSEFCLFINGAYIAAKAFDKPGVAAVGLGRTSEKVGNKPEVRAYF